MVVFVLGKHKKPLMPCTERRARLLLNRGRARVHRMYPFTFRLVDREIGEAQLLVLKLDPGSKQTGIALVREPGTTAVVISLIELNHRGATVRKALTNAAIWLSAPPSVGEPALSRQLPATKTHERKCGTKRKSRRGSARSTAAMLA